MSDKDQFPEPEGRDERTIFRPGPPARPAAGAPQSPAPQEAAAPRRAEARGASDPREMTQVHSDDHTVFRPNPAGRRPPARQPAPAPGAAPPPPRKASVQSADLAAPDANPITRAASPLLLLLGRLRAALLRAPGHGLVAQIAAGIERSEREMIAAGVAPGEANGAKLALCASADHVLANLPGEGRAGAGRPGGAYPGLMTRFFGENNGGRRFFDELDRLEKDPRTHFALLELFYGCLALAYQGGRQSAAAGAGAAAAMTSELHQILQKWGPAEAPFLSPHWRGQSLPSRAARLRVPFWAIAGFVGLLLFGGFVGLRISLNHRAETAARALAALNPATPVSIARKVEAPPPPAPPPTPEQVSQLDHIRTVLAPNIAAGTLSLEPSADKIIIRIVEQDLFKPGKTAIIESVKPLMSFIALALDDEAAVKVVGHSDDTPIANARFASNFELSLERANVVGALLKQRLSHPERVVTEGKGADAPIATNDTAEGRARNRRVEIVVPRSD
jgi:type VI secretion system protein ImpK